MLSVEARLLRELLLELDVIILVVVEILAFVSSSPFCVSSY